MTLTCNAFSDLFASLFRHCFSKRFALSVNTNQKEFHIMFSLSFICLSFRLYPPNMWHIFCRLSHTITGIQIPDTTERHRERLKDNSEPTARQTDKERETEIWIRKVWETFCCQSIKCLVIRRAFQLIREFVCSRMLCRKGWLSSN